MSRIRAGFFCWILLMGMVVAAVEVVDLRCEYAVNPMGVDVAQPRLSWRLQTDASDVQQAAWEVEVASQRDLLEEGRSDLWKSGRREGSSTQFIEYAGGALVSSQQVWWRVRTWTDDGIVSPWSEAGTWTMGQLSVADWQAEWVEADQEAPSVLLRKAFSLKGPIQRAVVHVSGLGHYVMEVNGHVIGEDLLTPGWTDYEETTLYDTRDITAFLQPGENSIGLHLGNGMYHVERLGRFAKFEGSFGKKRAILDMLVEYTDGSVERVGTNRSWRSAPGPITFSSIFGGETYDARLLPEDWSKADFEDDDWPFVRISETGQLSTLRALSVASEPLRVIEVRDPVEVRPLAAEGAWLYDFGQNTSYIPRIRIAGSAGSRVQIIPAEVLFPDGYPSRSSMGGIHRGTSWMEYIKRTDAVETWSPLFFYIGSRYMQVQLIAAQAGGALPELESIEGQIVHAAAQSLGHFETTNPLVNRIRDLVRWAQRSNMVSVLTDCPHREKLGWLEQYHLNGPSIRYEFDVARIFRKGVQDMEDAQLASGMVPNIAPEFTQFRGTFRSAAEWGAAFIAVPWQQYLFTGDLQLIENHYPAMQRYFDYLSSKSEEDILTEGLGDWYDLGPNHGPGRAQLTLPPLTATAFLYQDARLLSKMAVLLGRTDDAEAYAARAARIRNRFNTKFYNAEAGHYGSNSQAANAIALVMDLVEPEHRDRVLAALVQDVVERNYAMTAGDVGFRYLILALSDGGRDDLVYKMINHERNPGYGYQLKMGATALTEAWDASPSSSNNHFMLGHIMEWFYGRLLGIAPDEQQPGFRHVVLDPRPVPELEGVSGHYDSIQGRISVEWKQSDSGLFHYSVTLPPNTTASLYLPAGDMESTGEHEKITMSGAPRAREDSLSARILVHLESGSHSFTVQPEKD